jgi:hypothetical protein
MNGMFQAASSFNQNISFDTYYGYWNTSNVTDMSFMFSNANAFNGAIGWITSKVTNMREMFLNASSFNQYIGRQPFSFSTPTELWNTGQVKDMSAMFYNAINFNSYIGNWNTSNLNSFVNFRSSSPLSNANTPLRILQGGQ